MTWRVGPIEFYLEGKEVGVEFYRDRHHVWNVSFGFLHIDWVRLWNGKLGCGRLGLLFFPSKPWDYDE